jgi:hypothetical protein
MDTEMENAIERAKDAVALWLKLYGPGADAQANADERVNGLREVARMLRDKESR